MRPHTIISYIWQNSYEGTGYSVMRQVEKPKTIFIWEGIDDHEYLEDMCSKWIALIQSDITSFRKRLMVLEEKIIDNESLIYDDFERASLLKKLFMIVRLNSSNYVSPYQKKFDTLHRKVKRLEKSLKRFSKVFIALEQSKDKKEDFYFEDYSDLIGAIEQDFLKSAFAYTMTDGYC